MELYIIRHAQSTNNALADQKGRVCDPALTDLGMRQAKILANHLANGKKREPLWRRSDDGHQPGYGLTRLYCSAMWRALQTAQPIGRALGLKPEVWLDIHEQGGIFLNPEDADGPVGYPGKTRSEILAEFPDTILPEAVTEDGWWSGGYEDWPACKDRAIRVAGELRRMAGSGGRIALISHGGFIDILLKALFNQLPSLNFFYFHYNTAITRIDFRDGGYLDVNYLNRVDHLPPDLIS
ncbi:MAG: histidine phosphatase family protein [Anaerolineae bacterium]